MNTLADVIAGCLLIGAIALCVLVILAAFSGYDDTDDPTQEKRSRATLVTDYATGCQYLAHNRGGMTPRLDQDGKHICRAELIRKTN